MEVLNLSVSITLFDFDWKHGSVSTDGQGPVKLTTITMFVNVNFLINKNQLWWFVIYFPSFCSR